MLHQQNKEIRYELYQINFIYSCFYVGTYNSDLNSFDGFKHFLDFILIIVSLEEESSVINYCLISG